MALTIRPPTPAATQPPPAAGARFDALQGAIILMILVAVWRIQNLVPVLNAIKIQFVAPGVALLAVLADRDPRRLLRRTTNPLVYRLFGIALIMLLGAPTSLWAGKTVDFIFDDHAKTLLMMMLIAMSIRARADVERYFLVHIAGAMYYAYFVLTNFRVSARSGRLNNLIYYDSNDLALLLVCTIPLCVYFLRPASRMLMRVMATGALALFAVTLVRTGSRGGFLAFIACSAYLLFNFTAVPKRVRIYAVGALVGLVVTFGGSRYWTMMSTMLAPTQDYNWSNTTGRKQIWERGIGYMMSHPFLGVGARAFPQAEGHLSFAALHAQGQGMKWSAAHNSFVEVGAELGIIGLFLFVTSIYMALAFVRRVGHERTRRARDALAPMGHALAGTIIAYCVAGFFVSAGYSAYLYSIFGVVIGLMKVVQLEAAQQVAAPVRVVPTSAAPAPTPAGGWRGQFRTPRRIPSPYPGPATVAPRIVGR